MNNYVLYTTEKAHPFALNIANHLRSDLFTIQKKKFADGEINVEFNESVRGKSLIIITQIEMPYENLFELLLICDAARRCDAKEIVLVIPYLPHSRQERRGESRSPITARVVADLLQNAGVSHIISMDLHIGAIEGFYSIPFDKLYPTEIFLDKIRSLEIENLALVSPDFGFMKKMEFYQKELACNMAVINKTRLKANEVSKMELIGDVTGNNVVIIDDIIDTATTLVKASDLVLEKGALSVTVFATHGVMSYQSQFFNAYDRLTQSQIKKVYLSNTMGAPNEEAYHDEISKINYIDVSRVFAKAIQKIQKD